MSSAAPPTSMLPACARRARRQTRAFALALALALFASPSAVASPARARRRTADAPTIAAPPPTPRAGSVPTVVSTTRSVRADLATLHCAVVLAALSCVTAGGRRPGHRRRPMAMGRAHPPAPCPQPLPLPLPCRTLRASRARRTAADASAAAAPGRCAWRTTGHRTCCPCSVGLRRASRPGTASRRHVAIRPPCLLAKPDHAPRVQCPRVRRGVPSHAQR